jgi:integrative and conjugative element protein (TIGR02256 family)
MERSALEFRSQDRRFGLVLAAEFRQTLRERCLASWPNETGGILVGYYTERHETAIVSQLPPAPTDSVSARARFVRGLRGLQELLVRLWNQNPRNREYYLGEWHFHPGQEPIPSPQDEAQMRAIAKDPGYRCPEPLLVITGGSPQGNGSSISVRVYPRGMEPVRLEASSDRPRGDKQED